MKYIHWARKYTELPLFQYELPKDDMFWSYMSDRQINKPNGLWFGVEYDKPNFGAGEYGWRQWCEFEKIDDWCFDFPYEVSIKDNANILRLETAAEVYKFQQQFRYSKHDKTGNDDFIFIITTMFENHINWSRLYYLYQGILINPYPESPRWFSLDAPQDINGGVVDVGGWYNTWDCASGCIWDMNAIDIKPMF